MKIETLGFCRTRGYFVTSTQIKALRMTALTDPDLKKEHEMLYRYWQRILGPEPELRHQLGGNVHWRLRLLADRVEFEVYNAWLCARGLDPQKTETRGKARKAMRTALETLLVGLEYLPEQRPDICVAQATLFDVKISDVLRGQQLDRKRIQKLLARVTPALTQYLNGDPK